MAAKLELISKPIPWSLVVKAALLGGVWFFLPFPIFLILAFYFYLVPLFKPLELGACFLVTLVFSFLIPESFPSAVFLGVVFYLILGVKDLVFIHRKAVYQAVVLLTIFLMDLYFFFELGGWFGFRTLFWSVLVAFFSFLLMRGFLKYEGVVEEEAGWAAGWHKFLILGLVGFLTWELMFVLLFLPLGFIYQTAILFLTSVVFLELTLAYFNRCLSPRKVLFNFTLFFIFVVFILAGTKWEL